MNRCEPDVYVKVLYTLAKKFGTGVTVTCDGRMDEYGTSTTRWRKGHMRKHMRQEQSLYNYFE